MNEAGYVVCATCGDYAVDFNAVMLDCSTCENSYHHTCAGMGLGELGRRTAATNAMRKSKGKKNASADGDGDVTGTLYDWICPDCQPQRQRVPVPDKEKEEVLVIEDTDDEDEDDGERTTYIDLSYNVDLHRAAPSQRALLPTTTTIRRPAVHMQNVAGLLNRSTSNVGASTSTRRAADSNIAASASTSTSRPVLASTSTSTSPQSQLQNATPSANTRNVQTPLSPPPSRSPSRTGPTTNGTDVPFVDFTAMASSLKKRRRSSEAGEGEDQRAKKKSRVAGPVALSRTPVEPIDLTLSDDEVLVTPAAPSTPSRHAAASVSSRQDAASVPSQRDAASVSSGSRSRHGPGSVSSGTTDIATEDEPVPTRNLMRASLAGRTPRVPLPAASSSITRPVAPTRPAPSPTASSRSTVPSKRRLSASPSNSHPASVRRAVVHNQEQEDEDDEEHAFFRSRRTSGVGLTRTRSDAAVLPASTSDASPRSTAPTRTQSDGALALASASQPSANASGSRVPILLEKTSTGEADEPPAPASSHPQTSSRGPPSSRIGTIEAKATQAAVDDLPDYVSDEEHERIAFPATSTASRVPSAPTASSVPPASRAPSTRPTLAFTPATTASTSTATTTFRKPALPPPRAPSTARVPSPAPSTTQSQPLFLPDSPSPSPERRERESKSQRLMSLPPISFLDENVELDRVVTEEDEDELEDEDEDELASGVEAIRKRALKTKAKENAKAEVRLDDVLFDRTERRKHRVEEEGRSYVQQRLENVSEARTREGESSMKKKKHRERDRGSPLGLSAFEKTTHPVLDTGAGAASTSEKKKKHRDREGVVDALAVLSASASLEKKTKRTALGADSGEGSAKEKKKKHRDRDRDQGGVDLLAVPSTSLEKKTKRAVLGAGADTASRSEKEKKKKKHRDRDAVDPLAVPSLGLSASLEKTKRAALDAQGGEGESSTSSSVKDKKKKHRDGRSSTQGEGAGEQLDLLARPVIGLPRPSKKTVLGADVDACESSTSGSVKKKHRERVVAPELKEPATPERRVDDLTVSWGRLQELASFSPSNAKKTTIAQVDGDGDGDRASFPSTVREEASSSRQLGRKTVRPPPSPTLDKSSAVSSASTHRPLAAMSAARAPVTCFPAAGAVPSPAAPASSSSSAARQAASASRPDAEQRKEKQPMQTQRARKTVSRREDQDVAPAPAQVKARDPAPSSSTSALPERTKVVALDRADAPGKGKSTLDKYSARAVASSSSTVLPPSTSTLPPVVASSSRLKPSPSAAVPGPSSSRPSAPSTAPSSSRSKHRVADPSLPFEAPVVPRRKAIAGVDYPLPDLPVKPNKKATARKVPRTALVSDEETPMDVDVDVDARTHTSRKGKEREQAINVDDDSPPPPPKPKGKEKSVTVDRPKPPPIPRLRSASIWSSSTPTPAPSPYTTSSPSLDAVTAFLKKRRMANPLPSSSTVPSAPTQGQKMAATKRRLERGEHESDLPVPMSVLANAREMQMLRRLVKRGTVVKNTLKRSVGEVKTDVVRPFDWASYRVESERKEKETDKQGVEDFDTT